MCCSKFGDTHFIPDVDQANLVCPSCVWIRRPSCSHLHHFACSLHTPYIQLQTVSSTERESMIRRRVADSVLSATLFVLIYFFIRILIKQNIIGTRHTQQQHKLSQQVNISHRLHTTVKLWRCFTIYIQNSLVAKSIKCTMDHCRRETEKTALLFSVCCQRQGRSLSYMWHKILYYTFNQLFQMQNNTIKRCE